MDNTTLLATALALAMDAFAVAAAISAALPVWTGRHVFRLSWHFGLFQAFMTAFGWFGGMALSSVLAPIDHWIVFLILSFLGLKMIIESFNVEEKKSGYDPTRGWSLVGLSVATSIDAMAVGVSIGLLREPILLPSIVIGITALVLTFIATRMGRMAGNSLGSWAERAGGAVLILLGTRFLIQNL